MTETTNDRLARWALAITCAILVVLAAGCCDDTPTMPGPYPPSIVVSIDLDPNDPAPEPEPRPEPECNGPPGWCKKGGKK